MRAGYDGNVFEHAFPFVRLSGEGPRGSDRRCSGPERKRDKMLDETVVDSFLASGPPSALPDPSEDFFSLSTDMAA